MISSLKERITLQKRRIKTLDNGDVAESWCAQDTVWASISPVPSKVPQEKYTVCIRYRAGGISGFLWHNKPYVVLPPVQTDNARWIKGIAIPRGDTHD